MLSRLTGKFSYAWVQRNKPTNGIASKTECQADFQNSQPRLKRSLNKNVTANQIRQP